MFVCFTAVSSVINLIIIDYYKSFLENMWFCAMITLPLLSLALGHIGWRDKNRIILCLSNWSIKAGVANLKHDIAVIFTNKTALNHKSKDFWWRGAAVAQR